MITERTKKTKKLEKQTINIHSGKAILSDPSYKSKSKYNINKVFSAKNGKWECFYHIYLDCLPNLFVTYHKDHKDDYKKNKLKFKLGKNKLGALDLSLRLAGR